MYKNIYLGKKNSKSKPKYKTINIKKPVRKTRIPNIVVLDNDECLGQFGIFSMLVSIAKMDYHLPINMNILKRELVTNLLSKGVARPYLINLFQILHKLKLKKKIDKVVMYTSAPNRLSHNRTGYIYFLKNCLETYCKTPKLYDMVFHRDNIKARISKCGATIKDVGNVLLKNNKLRVGLLKNNQKLVKYVNLMSKNIIMVDDKPNNIIKRRGQAIGVKPYRYPCQLIDVYKCIRNVPNFEQKIKSKGLFESIIRECRQELLRFDRKHNDTDLAKVCKIILRKYN